METNNSIFPKSKAQINREKYAAQNAEKAIRLERQKIRNVRIKESRVPKFGSAEWCETQGDNIGDSGDY